MALDWVESELSHELSHELSLGYGFLLFFSHTFYTLQ